MMKRTVSCLLAVQWLLLAQSGFAGNAPDEAVKALMQRYNEVEAQLERAIHYEKKVGTQPETTVQHAWFNEFGGLLKVATVRTDATGKELKEFFPYEPDENPAAMRMFALTRRENALSNGVIRVDEERVYLRRSEGRVLTLRKLTKSAEFKTGAALDMEHVRNVVTGPLKNDPRANDEELAKRDWESMEEPKRIAQALRSEGGPEPKPPLAGEEVVSAKEGAGWTVNSVSPDGQWNLRLLPADEKKQTDGGFVIAKRGSQQTAVELSEEAAGTFADAARIVWAPNSKRFAFHFQPGVRVQTLQLFQLDGKEWRELRSPNYDDATSGPLERSMAAQRRQLKLPSNKGGRLISATCEVRKWIDSTTALLLTETHETFEIKDELEQVGDGCFATLKFDPDGNWKVIRTRLLSDQKPAALNRVEREALENMQKESVGDN